MYSLIIYKNEGNLGNAIQTMGLAHLVSPSVGVFHDEITKKSDGDTTLVCNGWFGSYPKVENVKTIFCGFHLSSVMTPKDNNIFDWLKFSKFPIGARDPKTADYLNSIGIKSEFIGCGSLLFPKYEGERSGEISVDFNGPGKKYTHEIPSSMTWKEKWDLSKKMIEIYKKSSVVYTNRLHVALPCLALGTPVYIEKNSDKDRFSILDALGVEYDKVQKNIDISWLKNKYLNFARNNLNIKNIIDPIMPTENL